MNRARSGLTAAGLLLGFGLGGFVDGILLHQILRWHHMLSAVYPPTNMENMRVNMLADGWFHAGVWLATVAGLALLWRSLHRNGTAVPTRSFVGLLLAGWGVFNLLEGLVDHQILGVHHVREGSDWLAWDLGFLAIGGVLLIALGWVLVRAGNRAGRP